MIASYLKLAWKVLLRRKVFTAISLFGIAFTLVVLLVATAMLDHIFAPRAPESRQARTLGFYTAALYGDSFVRSGGVGYALLQQCARDLPHVEQFSLFTFPATAYSFVNGSRVESILKRTDGEFWRILDFDFVEGRPYTDADVTARRFVAVINESTRQRYFGAATAVGRSIVVDDQRFDVVGVVRDVSVLRLTPFADVWVPYTTAKTDSYTKDLVGDFMAIAVARSAGDFREIQDEYRSRVSHVRPPDPKRFTAVNSRAETFFDFVAATLFSGAHDPEPHPERLQIALAVLTGLFILLPAVNLVNLNVSRILERGSEIGVRRAFGASKRTLIVQFVVENLVLTMCGALLGLVASAIVLDIINRSGLILYEHLGLNLRIFGWGVVLALVFGLVSGVYPAWRMSRLRPVEALKGTSR